MVIPGKREKTKICFKNFFSLKTFSDDEGSDSSADDGLPKHLEVIAAAKVDSSGWSFLKIAFCFSFDWKSPGRKSRRQNQLKK